MSGMSFYQLNQIQPKQKIFPITVDQSFTLRYYFLSLFSSQKGKFLDFIELTYDIKNLQLITEYIMRLTERIENLRPI